ncbi:helix-turn-helix domain-containing protein [Streptosporangium sandarakinum]
MEAKEKSRRQTNEIGPTGARVAETVRKLRDRRGLSTTQLSKLLGELGRPIQPTGITKIEKRERKVDVDDLVALAIALGVSPSTLLFPSTVEGESLILDAEVMEPVDNRRLWEWADTLSPLTWAEGSDGTVETVTFRLQSRPTGDKRVSLSYAGVGDNAAMYVPRPDPAGGDEE